MASVEELRKVLRDFNFRYGAQVSAVITKTGIPIALQSTRPVLEEHFATMAATLVGSTEVIYRQLGGTPALTITARSEENTIVILNLERNAFFIAVAPLTSVLAGDVAGATASLAKVLDPLRPLSQLVH